MIDFCFKVEDGEFISVDGQGAKLAEVRRPGFAVFTKSNLKTTVKYLLQSCCFKLGNRTFRKIIEISMDSDHRTFYTYSFLTLLRKQIDWSIKEIRRKTC